MLDLIWGAGQCILVLQSSQNCSHVPERFQLLSELAECMRLPSKHTHGRMAVSHSRGLGHSQPYEQVGAIIKHDRRYWNPISQKPYGIILPAR